MNKTQLSITLKDDTIRLFSEGIKSIKTDKLLNVHFVRDKNNLIVSDVKGVTKKYYLDEYENIFVVGAGKASAAMAEKLEGILDDKIDSGIVVTKYGFGSELKNIELVEAGHPLPDSNGVNAATKIIDLCSSATENDLIISLISGGASSLLVGPAAYISLEEKIQTTKLLLNSGATIDEMNAVRKHISNIKGGHLMKAAFPATVISIIISDVIGDDPSVIGSGPFTFDKSTYFDCLTIFNKYNLINSVPSSILQFISEGDNKNKPETPSENDPIFSKADNFIIGNNLLCLQHIRESAEKLGYNSKILNTHLSGESKEVGKNIVTDAVEFLKHGTEIGKKYCLIFGGETTVKIVGSGKGGRNQEMVLSAAIKLSGHEGIAMLSCGTDGNDGPTNAAGAYCDWMTIEKGKKIGLVAEDHLLNNDSYNYFNKLGDLIITGPTKTNVMDIQIVLINTN